MTGTRNSSGESRGCLDVCGDVGWCWFSSRRHATIEYLEEEKSFVIRDCGSLNGIAVNNVRVSRSKLKSGDVIQLAGAAQVPVNRKLKSIDASARYRFKEIPSRESTPISSSSAAVIKGTSSDPPAAVASSTAVPSKEVGQMKSVCGVDKSVVQSHLSCALCRYRWFAYSSTFTQSHHICFPSLLFMDAVVLRCSHSFCRACIELYWEKQLQQPHFNYCPTCGSTSASSSTMGYCRCSALDDLAWLMIDSASHKEREVRHLCIEVNLIMVIMKCYYTRSINWEKCNAEMSWND